METMSRVVGWSSEVDSLSDIKWRMFSGSENNNLYVYYKELSKPILTHSFGGETAGTVSILFFIVNA